MTTYTLNNRNNLMQTALALKPTIRMATQHCWFVVKLKQYWRQRKVVALSRH